jgi:hypothetical protein
MEQAWAREQLRAEQTATTIHEDGEDEGCPWQRSTGWGRDLEGMERRDLVASVEAG